LSAFWEGEDFLAQEGKKGKKTLRRVRKYLRLLQTVADILLVAGKA
jgi:hypothetical protein